MCSLPIGLFVPLSSLQGDCSAQDPYADYPGALRCMMEGAGDVAFTKHNIAPEYAKDGTTPADWSSADKVGFLLAAGAGMARVPPCRPG